MATNPKKRGIRLLLSYGSYMNWVCTNILLIILVGYFRINFV